MRFTEVDVVITGDIQGELLLAVEFGLVRTDVASNFVSFPLKLCLVLLWAVIGDK